MASKVIWSRRAIVDLEQIGDYIARDSVQYANRVAERMIAAIERVAAFPQMGRVVPESNDPELREVIVYSYRLIYHARTDLVEVVTIIHGARQFSPDDLGK
jgi:addiction module RelE/StbE family toxin